MLAVASTIKGHHHHEDQGTHMVDNFNPSIIDDNNINHLEHHEDQFFDLSSDETSLLEKINFDDLFMGINDGSDDVLPDLEMDSELLAEFSFGTEESDFNVSVPISDQRNEEEKKVSDSRELRDVEHHQSVEAVNPEATKESDNKERKSSSSIQSKFNSKNQGKRKVKVDWTPELHRRFVQAVEQLGVDKAVPSRILELMGVDCLTRHNVASHLQKYRSHRKHLLAREAEAASWTQRRQYGTAGVTGGGRKMGPWHAPPPHSIGVPHMTTPPILHHAAHFRPLYVWGHPSMDQSLLHVWPKHLTPQPPPAAWPPSPPNPSYWQHRHQRLPNGLATPGTPCFLQSVTPIRFQALPVTGIPPPHTDYKSKTRVDMAPTKSDPLLDFHPSKETVDAAIGDVLAKPWLPLPIGLRPPSVDGVIVELQRQGVARIPSATFA